MFSLKNSLSEHVPRRICSSSLYAAGIEAKGYADAIKAIFEFMVFLSDHTDLLGIFLSLKCPKMFTYGSQYSSLSYLPALKEDGVELAEIATSGHFPMYSKPVETWRRIARFLRVWMIFESLELKASI
jgi:pimeloyl-ACP methyl ester carboxylesterase